ncbi:MAG: hypothetical protein M3O30_15065 [Planctomycetota bacterium]|nr:hypothetical protein [Planctomycetota bacterium]
MTQDAGPSEYRGYRIRFNPLGSIVGAVPALQYTYHIVDSHGLEVCSADSIEKAKQIIDDLVAKTIN